MSCLASASLPLFLSKNTVSLKGFSLSYQFLVSPPKFPQQGPPASAADLGIASSPSVSFFLLFFDGFLHLPPFRRPSSSSSSSSSTPLSALSPSPPGIRIES